MPASSAAAPFKTWRAMLRRRPLLRRSRPCLVARSNSHTPRRRRFAPESWDGGGAPSLPFGTKGGAERAIGAAAPIETWRAMLRRRPLLRRSRLCIQQRRRFAPEAWDDTEVIPPFGTKGAPNAQSARQRPSKLRERCSVGAHFCGEAAFASSRDAASRLNLGTAAARHPSIWNEGGAERAIGAAAPIETWRAMLRRRPLLRRSRLCIQQRRRCAPEAWDDTEVIPPFGTKGAPNA